MKPKYLERVPELDGMIEKARVVTIVTHTHPDGDAIGSALGHEALPPQVSREGCLSGRSGPGSDTLAF